MVSNNLFYIVLPLKMFKFILFFEENYFILFIILFDHLQEMSNKLYEKLYEDW